MTTTVEKATVRRLGLVDLIPTPDNPRQVVEKDPEFTKLVESVRAIGVRIPVHVRPHPDQEGKWDLRCGERRWRASKAAKLKTILAIVHEGMSDEEALELTIVENLERDDLAPTEEGKAVALLLERNGGDVRAAAAVLGRSERWIVLRARLKDLTPNWQKAVADPEGAVYGWGIGRLELIARFEPEQQDRILADIDDKSLWLNNPTVAELEQAIGREYMLELSLARWPLDDAELFPAVGACTACPKRTGAQGVLFEEEGAEGQRGRGAKGDRCLDRACWAGKAVAFVDGRIAAAKAKHPEVIAIHGKEASHEEREQISEHLGGGVAGAYDFAPAKKSDEGAIAAVVVSGKSLGEVRWVKPFPGAGRRSASGSAVKSLAEKRAALRQRRNGLVLGWVAEQIEAAGPLPLPATCSLIAGFGAKTAAQCGDFNAEPWDVFDAAMEKPASLDEWLWRSVRPILVAHVEPQSHEKVFDRHMGHAVRICGLLEIDLAALEARAAEEKREPKSWKKEEGAEGQRGRGAEGQRGKGEEEGTEA